jgi:nitronate monooxygenase
MDGRNVSAALKLGAAAVQMGTAFLPCPESGAADAHKRALLGATSDNTALTRAFSGRPARGIPNAFMAMVAGKEDSILPFRQQNDLTRPMRNAAGRQGVADFMSLWAGQGVARCRALPAAVLVETLLQEAAAVSSPNDQNG